MDLLIHIGFQKTGTTAIQDFLVRQDSLLRKSGILYPATGRAVKKNGIIRNDHQEFSWFYTGKHASQNSLPPWSALFNEAQKSGLPRILISAEGFGAGMDPEKIGQLKKDLGNIPVKIIAYTRDPEKFLLSAYKQNVKMGDYHRSFGHFIRERGSVVDFHSRLQGWANAFGKENLIIRNYDQASSTMGLFNDFFSCLGINLPDSEIPDPKKSKANVSPDDRIVSILRWINKLDLIFPNKKLKKLRRLIREENPSVMKWVRWLQLLGQKDIMRPSHRDLIRKLYPTFY